MSDKEEIWKDVPNTNYMASSLGNVRHKKGIKNRKVFNNGHGYLSFVTNTDGYKINYVHRFVLMAFDYREDHPGLDANHIDFNRSNNRVENLRWDTRKDNINYSITNGRFLKANIKHSELMRGMMNNGTNPLLKLSKESKLQRSKTWKSNYKKEKHPFFKVFGTESPNSKLNEEDVVDARRLYSGGMPMLRISRLFGVSYSAINSIVYRKTWGHIL